MTPPASTDGMRRPSASSQSAGAHQQLLSLCELSALQARGFRFIKILRLPRKVAEALGVINCGRDMIPAPAASNWQNGQAQDSDLFARNQYWRPIDHLSRLAAACLSCGFCVWLSAGSLLALAAEGRLWGRRAVGGARSSGSSSRREWPSVCPPASSARDFEIQPKLINCFRFLELRAASKNL